MDHICWEYKPRSKKAILPFDSSHTKLVKRGIASSCFNSALTKSCTHKVSHSFDNQISRLLASGFPSTLLVAVASSLLKKKGASPSVSPQQSPNKYVVMPYIHTISHNLKRIGLKHGVNLVFTAPFKLSRLCALAGEKKPRNQGAKRSTRSHLSPVIRKWYIKSH